MKNELKESEKFEVKLSFEQLSTLADLAMIEKSREEFNSEKACFRANKTEELDKIAGILIRAMFL